jgi:hypothetical protein
MFNDNVKAHSLGPDGVYTRVARPAKAQRCRVQEALQEEARRRTSQALDRAGVTFRPAHADSSGA